MTARREVPVAIPAAVVAPVTRGMAVRGGGRAVVDERGADRAGGPLPAVFRGEG